MPLDPLDPNVFSLSPEQRNANKLSTAGRRLGALERSSLNQVIRSRQYAEALAEVSTSSTSFVDLGGPAITVTLDASQFVAVFLQLDTHLSSAGATVGLAGISIDGAPADQVISTTAGTYETRRSTPGNTAGTTASFGGYLISPLAAGTRSIAVQHMTGAGAVPAFFRNRRLWVEVI